MKIYCGDYRVSASLIRDAVEYYERNCGSIQSFPWEMSPNYQPPAGIINSSSIAMMESTKGGVVAAAQYFDPNEDFDDADDPNDYDDDRSFDSNSDDDNK